MVKAKNIYPIAIAGRTLRGEIKSIPLDLIRLDPHNVRFKHVPRKLTDKQIEDLIWTIPDTNMWYGEIIYAQGLTEKPFVQQADDGYVVREGNMRIVCLRKLKEAIQARREDRVPIEKIDPQPCVVFPKDVTEKEMGIFLTRMHVKAKAPWAGFNKAGQVYELSEILGLDHAEIAESCGISKLTVGRMIAAYDAMRNYFEKYPDVKPENNLGIFSYFDEFYKQKSKLKKEGMDPSWIDNNLKLFMKWVHNDQFETGKEVRALPSVMKYKETYQMLLGGEKMDKVLKKLSQIDPTLGDETFRRIDKTAKLYDFSHKDMMEISKNPSKLQYLKKLHQKLGSVIKTIESIKKS